jgi:nucleotide-binding universal stress UspA family protein
MPLEDDLLVQASLPLSQYVELKTRDTLERFDRALPPDVRAWCHVSEIVRPGRPADVILAEADARNADLIVMGAQGRGGLPLALFGSTTQTVVHRATCPVLTTRAPAGADASPHAVAVYTEV